MNDNDIDQLIAASTVRDDELHALDLAAGEADLKEHIMSTLDPHPRQKSRRRRLLAPIAIGATVALGGTAYALTGGLSTDRADVIERANPCGIDAGDGEQVATATVDGQLVEYWTFDDTTSHGDFVFTDDGTGGGGGCGPLPREDAHPVLPWAEYILEAGKPTSTYTAYGQAPPGNDTVVMTFDTGTIEADVQPNGFFVARQALPTSEADRLLRVDAYDDGQLTITNVAPFGN